MEELFKGIHGLFKPVECLNVEPSVSRFNLKGGRLGVQGPRRSVRIHGARGWKCGRLSPPGPVILPSRRKSSRSLSGWVSPAAVLSAWQVRSHGSDIRGQDVASTSPCSVLR